MIDYNTASYQELVKMAVALIDGHTAFPLNRGIGPEGYFQIIDNTPVIAKERPRNRTFHTPKATRDYESALRKTARQKMWRAGFKHPFRFPLRVELLIRQQAPASWPPYKLTLALQKQVFVLKRDLDNMEKAVMDAFNGVVYADDRQIVKMNKSNIVSTKPGFTIRFYPYGLTNDETTQVCYIAGRIASGKLDRRGARVGS